MEERRKTTVEVFTKFVRADALKVLDVRFEMEVSIFSKSRSNCMYECGFCERQYFVHLVLWKWYLFVFTKMAFYKQISEM